MLQTSKVSRKKLTRAEEERRAGLHRCAPQSKVARRCFGSNHDDVHRSPRRLEISGRDSKGQGAAQVLSSSSMQCTSEQEEFLAQDSRQPAVSRSSPLIRLSTSFSTLHQHFSSCRSDSAKGQGRGFGLKMYPPEAWLEP